MFLLDYTPEQKSIKLIITTDHTATVNIYSPYSGVNKTVFVNQSVAHVDLPNSIDSIFTGFTSRGIHILSDKPISVVGFSKLYSRNCCSALAFNALPADKKGKYFKIQTLFRNSKDIQSFGIVSVYPDTSVDIKSIAQQPLTISGKTLYNHDNVTITLKQLQCYYYETNVNFDISGLEITGTKPFVVFSGNKQVDTFINLESAVESIPPTDTWGKQFIVPLIKATTIYLKIVMNNPKNVVNITGNNYFRSFTSSYKIQVELPAGSYAVTAKQSILLSVFTKYVNTSISPFMSIIPAITQFSNDYIVAGPSIFSYLHIPYRNFLSIVIDQIYASGLRMNGNVVQALEETSIPLENVNYKCMIVNLSGSSADKISHLQSNIMFGAIVYGYGYDEAYGYPAGLRL
ncbi:uncharacterized protein LOC134723070 [Mytilus trossulus]|uniref:uncharacterized protein LOC134723070 n=1 Tax=Mytilus trossulus TaxID=6551 RepID=UPI00300751D9